MIKIKRYVSESYTSVFPKEIITEYNFDGFRFKTLSRMHDSAIRSNLYKFLVTPGGHNPFSCSDKVLRQKTTDNGEIVFEILSNYEPFSIYANSLDNEPQEDLTIPADKAYIYALFLESTKELFNCLYFFEIEFND